MRYLMVLVLLACSHASYADDAIRHYFEALDSGYNLPVHGDRLIHTQALRRFYQNRNYQIAWYQDGAMSEMARELYLTIETASVDGLHPEDYHNRALQQHCPSEGHDRSAYCDLLFTDAFFLLAQHLLAGKVNPRTLEPGWQSNRWRDGLVTLLENAFADSAIKSALANLRPRPLGYERLMAALRRLRVATDYPEWTSLEVSPSIEPGQADDRLATIVDRLVFWGDMPAPLAPVEDYNTQVQQGIQWFQARHGLEPDGVIGEATLRELNIGPVQRAQQIMVNLERWRWLAEDLGPKHVLVNLAGGPLEAVEHGKTVFELPVMIGEHFRRAPAFSERMRYMVFNPGWTLSRQLAAEALLPLLKNDVGRVAQLGMTLFQGSTPIDITSVDWAQVTPEQFDYRAVQAPGPRNALGQVRFAFPNEFHVELHGAPQEDLISEQSGFSLGSIRVERPLELAAWLMGSADAGSHVEALLAKGAPVAFYLDRPLPVHITYRTAWVNSQGALNFRRDTFERDKAVYEALTRSLSPAAPIL